MQYHAFQTATHPLNKSILFENPNIPHAPKELETNSKVLEKFNNGSFIKVQQLNEKTIFKKVNVQIKQNFKQLECKLSSLEKVIPYKCLIS